ncbi:hypothetical protein [Nautilia sp.]
MEVVVKIDNSKFNEFKNLIRDMNAEIINSYPDEIVVGSVEGVRKRIKEAQSDDFISEEEEKKLFEKLYKKYSL